METTPVPSAPGAVYEGRVARLRASLKPQGCGGLVVSCRENVRYLVGFAGSSGWVLVTEDDLVLATDSRYIEQASAQMPCGRACLVGRGLVEYVVEYIAERRLGRFGFEADNQTFSSVSALEGCLRERGADCRMVSTSGLVESLREVKDAVELDAIRRAAVLADGALKHARQVLRPGMTEAELAWQLERWLRENGSGPLPFEIIVASGPNAALPHATPSARHVNPGEPVVIDLGATVDGYCSDLTRTLFLGRMDVPFGTVYAEVLAAQCAAIDGLASGMTGRDADALARGPLEAAGHGPAFSHGLGHGVGLEIHERPTVNGRSGSRLGDGMVFTVEPGVYLPGRGGVRIEDTVVLLDGKAEQLTFADKGDPVVAVPV